MEVQCRLCLIPHEVSRTLASPKWCWHTCKHTLPSFRRLSTAGTEFPSMAPRDSGPTTRGRITRTAWWLLVHPCWDVGWQWLFTKTYLNFFHVNTQLYKAQCPVLPLLNAHTDPPEPCTCTSEHVFQWTQAYNKIYKNTTSVTVLKVFKVHLFLEFAQIS